MAKKRTSQLLAELRKLADSAVDNLYKRIELSCEVMADLDWIAVNHGGSDLKAADYLQAEYFRDLGGYVTLGKLMAMYRNVSKEEWASVKYDIAAVEIMYDEQIKGDGDKDRPQRTSWKKVAEDRAIKIAELEAQVKQLMKANAELQEENTDLRSQVARLEGRMEEMERWSNRSALVAR